MKTEAEIRKFRDNLRALLDRPCTCETPPQRLVCAAMKVPLRQQIALLTAILEDGDPTNWDDAIEQAAALAQKVG